MSHGVNRECWGLGLSLAAQFYAGLSIRLEIDIGPWWYARTFVVWHSPAAEQRSWDRWNAECLAGEHEGITVTVGTPPVIPGDEWMGGAHG